MLGLLYHHATLLPLTLIVTFSAHISTNAILKNMKKNMKNNMKVYISGKIGEEVISEATRRKFAKAEEMLKAKGFEVFNPTSEEWQASLREGYEKDKRTFQPYEGAFPEFYGYALLRDLMVLSAKDAIYMLADWVESSGANVELDFVRATKMRIFWERKEDAQLNGEDFENYKDAWLPIE